MKRIKDFMKRNKKAAKMAEDMAIHSVGYANVNSEDVNTLFGSVSMTLSNATVAERMHPNKMTVEKLDRGYYAEVGCKKLAFKTLLELTKAIEEYYTDPKKAEKKYIK